MHLKTSCPAKSDYTAFLAICDTPPSAATAPTQAVVPAPSLHTQPCNSLFSFHSSRLAAEDRAKGGAQAARLGGTGDARRVLWHCAGPGEQGACSHAEGAPRRTHGRRRGVH